ATPADEGSTFVARGMSLFDRLRRGHHPAPEPEAPERTVVEITPPRSRASSPRRCGCATSGCSRGSSSGSRSSSSGSGSSSSRSEAVDKIESWVNSLGANGTSGVKQSAESGTSNAGHTLIHGLGQGIKDLTSLIFFLTFSAFSTFFLLKDGPAVRRFIDRSLTVPVPVATVITSNVIKALRRYFLAVPLVAAFNAVVIGLP